MNILFVVNDIFFAEYFGPMVLSSLCKKHGHKTRLLIFRGQDILKDLDEFQPDVVAYSVMTPGAGVFLDIDVIVRKWIDQQGSRVYRIMGGPHPTFFHEVLEEMDLDAITVGEADNALVKILSNLERGLPLEEIANVIPRGGSIDNMKRELINDLDQLPFYDRELLMEAAPQARYFNLIGYNVGRGCPFKCTYCHNDLYNKLFKGCGKVVRRRSVEPVIQELEHNVKHYGPVKQIRIFDDTFAFTVDDWLKEFLAKYKERIGLPFYCLLRPNLVTDEMGEILAAHGCHSVSMSIEAADDQLRNDLLKRNISRKSLVNAFSILHKHGINAQTIVMLGLPGSTVEQDFESFYFMQSMKPSLGLCSIWAPYPNTSLTQYAVDSGYLDEGYNFRTLYAEKSRLSCYSEKEKQIQINLLRLSALFCDLPRQFNGILRILVRLPLGRLYQLIGFSYTSLKYYTSIFGPAVPRNPIVISKLFYLSLSNFFKKAGK